MGLVFKSLRKEFVPPEEDDRSQFWNYLFWMVNRERPYTQAQPLPISLLACLEFVDRLNLPAQPHEVVGVIPTLDDTWLDWWRNR